MIKRKPNWIINIETTCDRSGLSFYTVYENNKSVFVKNAEHLRKLINKYNPIIYATDAKTSRLLDIFKIDHECVKMDYSIR